MADVHSEKQRSYNMSRIRGKNTSPELLVRKSLFRMGFRYRLHVKNLPGKPDLVFPKYKAVVFVNGCFWHYHNCTLFRLPATRQQWWKKKLAGNRERDKNNIKKLVSEGWRVLVVWECCLKGNKKDPKAIEKIRKWLHSGKIFTEIKYTED